MFDRKTYFDHVREELFSGALSQQNVDGQGIILGLWEGQYLGTPMTDIRWLAYMLATVFHETAKKMWPIREYGLGKGKEYGVPNEDGNVFYGRGFVQLTWEENYQRMSAALSLIDDRDLTKHPDLALDSLIAARIMSRGMAEGMFTGAKLGQYFNDDTDDPIGARVIINGHDQDTLIAGYHAEFLIALERSQKPGWA